MVVKNRMKYTISKVANAPWGSIVVDKWFIYHSVSMLRKMVSAGIDVNGDYSIEPLVSQLPDGEMFKRPYSSGFQNVIITGNIITSGIDNDYYASIAGNISLTDNTDFIDDISVHVHVYK